MKSVDEYLNSVSYEDDPNYVPSEFALNFINFIKLVNGPRGEENKTPIVHLKMLDGLTKKGDVVNLCHRGIAKALGFGTKILTPTGFIPVEDIVVGDTAYDRNGESTKVTHISETFMKPMYRITLTDGSTLDVSEDHINIVQKRTSVMVGTKKINEFSEYELTTKELLDKGILYNRTITSKQTTGKEYKWFIPLITNEVDFPKKDCPIDPYTLGAILGDGHIDVKSGMVSITGHKDDLPELLSYMPYKYQTVYSDTRHPDTLSTRLLGMGGLIKWYLGTPTISNKFIPDDILFGSIEQRLECLRGLMDTDGTVSSKGNCSFTSISLALAKGVQHIVKSLGGYSSITHHTSDYQGYYHVIVNLANYCPFKLKRKANLWKPNNSYKSGNRVAIESIEPITIRPSRCLAVDSDTHSFLTEDVIVTHNTTVFGEYLILYLATYGKLPNFGDICFMLYVSDSMENGVKNMRKNLETRYNNSEFLQKVLPTVRFTDNCWEFTNLDGHQLVVNGYGASTGVRGTKKLGTRPQLALLDDLLSDDDAKSPTIISSVENTVYKAITHALHPKKHKIVWCGTPFNKRDPLYKAVESGVWVTNVYPVCEKFPCSREEFRGSWEDRFTYDYVLEQYNKAKATGTIQAFNQELMLRIMSDEDRLVTASEISWFSLKDLMASKTSFNYYITTDFAVSAKDSADYSVISVWAYSNNGDLFWVDGVVKRQTIDISIDDLFNLNSVYKPMSVGIEVTGQQGGFIDLINRESLRRNNYINLAKEINSTRIGIRPVTNKLARFNSVLPWFKLHKVHFPRELEDDPRVVEFIEELTLASASGFKSKHDDCIDTISQLASMNLWKPSMAPPNVSNTSSGSIFSSSMFEEEDEYNPMSSYMC
jgi:predicted phage terminase large subunit-like protein